jgi:arginyl-tRNA synthetase
MVTDELQEVVATAARNAAASGDLRLPSDLQIEFDRPKRREHGDWSTNLALVLARGQGSPRDIAQLLVDSMPESDLVDSVDVAGPGFINFHLSAIWLHEVVRRAANDSSGFGHSDEGRGRKMNVEYISANPTGPVNVVSGRHAAVGDAIANLLEATGHEVTREFYVNDSGRQAELFGQSIDAHYRRLQGEDAAIPDEGYQGDYVADLAEELAKQAGDKLASLSPEERVATFTELGIARMIEEMQESLARFGTRLDVWFRESSLHEKGEVESAIRKLETDGYMVERDGAKWFLASKFGDDKDRVVIKSNGEFTYLAADLAYLLDKASRGFDHLVYIWGADHHGTVARLRAAADALGIGRDGVEVRLVQVVTLLRAGAAVKASKRAGVLVALDELVDEVGPDAARYTFLTRTIDAPLEFDIELAKEQAPENPVYYVQYAHARISSILRKADEEGLKPETSANLGSLTHPSEVELMRKLAAFEEVVPEAAAARGPQKIARYIEELASTFSGFYRDCRVISDDKELSLGRLLLCTATRRTIKEGLSLLGVDSPERM